MQQVGRFFFKSIIVFIILFVLVGCTSKSEPTFSHKVFDNNITKDTLLHAVKRVFSLTDREDFIIDSYRNDINVTRPKGVYKIFTMDIHNDHFDFHVENNNTTNSLKGTISISRTHSVDFENRKYIDQDSSTYKLFWDRVEYLLGLQENWRKCTYEYLDGFMCDRTELEYQWVNQVPRIDLKVTSFQSFENDHNTSIVEDNATGFVAEDGIDSLLELETLDTIFEDTPQDKTLYDPEHEE